MKMNIIMKGFINFLPIFLVFLLATYTPEFVSFSHTILGKLFAVFIILFYLKLDIIIGAFVCILVILYYQTDYVENMLNIEGFENTKKQDGKIEETNQSEPVVQVINAADDIITEDKIEGFDIQDVAIQTTNSEEFRKVHCKKGHLIHKGQIIKPEMSEHIFKEIKQNDFHKCNVCDPSCDAEIISNHIAVEEDLIKPKSSNDLFITVWENMQKSTEQFLYHN